MSKIGKTLCVVGAATAVSFGALCAANASESVISAIVACKAIADDRQRLGCLDAVGASLEKGGSEENSVSLFGITASPAKADSFTTGAAGMSQQNVERGTDGVVEAITANVRKWSHDSRGQITIVLDNGQVWRQADSSEIHLATDPKTPQSVRISRGVIGGFVMTIGNKARGHKVRRVAQAAG